MRVYNFNAVSNTLSEINGSPFAGFGAATVSYVNISQDGTLVCFTKPPSNTAILFQRNTVTGVLTQVTGSPFTLGNVPSYPVFSPDNIHLYIPTANGASSPIYGYGFVATQTYNLCQFNFDPLSGLAGEVLINGGLIVNGFPVTTQGGTATNDNAPIGYVGEYIQAVVAATNTGLTSGAPLNVSSLTLTPGDWDFGGSVVFTGTGTTSFTQAQAGFNTASATLPGTHQQFVETVSPAIIPGSTFAAGCVPGYRLSIAVTTTLYLIGQAAFTVSTAGAGGMLWARRRR
jgi:hypothetical protein